MRKCSDCEREAVARGLCSLHYKRWFRAGGSEVTRKSGSTLARVLEAIERGRTADACVTTGVKPCAKTGYAGIRYRGKHRGVHTLACEFNHGPPPTPEHEVAHSCNNRPCVTGAHVRWDTHENNLRDRVEHGTVPHGEKSGTHRLTRKQAVEIYHAAGTLEEIGDRYGVHLGTVWCIKNGKTWARYTGHVPCKFVSTC